MTQEECKEKMYEGTWEGMEDEKNRKKEDWRKDQKKQTRNKQYKIKRDGKKEQ